MAGTGVGHQSGQMKTSRYRPVLAGSLAAALASCANAARPILSLTATTDNVSGAHESIRIDVLRWSTDAERDQLLAAWNLTAPPAGGRGRGGRGRGAAVDPAPDPAAVDGNDEPPAGRAGRGGRGGRGGGRAGAADAPRPTPEGALEAALGTAPTVGHLWSSEVAGYSLRSAVKLAEPDGGERIMLDHRPASGRLERFVEAGRIGRCHDLRLLRHRAALELQRRGRRKDFADRQGGCR